MKSQVVDLLAIIIGAMAFVPMIYMFRFMTVEERPIALLLIGFVASEACFVITLVGVIGLLCKATLSRNYAIVFNVAIVFFAATLVLTLSLSLRGVVATGLVFLWGITLGLRQRQQIAEFSQHSRAMAMTALLWATPAAILIAIALGVATKYGSIPPGAVALVPSGVLVASAAVGALSGARRRPEFQAA